MDVFWQEDKGQKQMLFRQPPKCSVLGVKIRPRWQEQPPRKQTIVGLILGDHLDLVAWVPVIPKRLVLRCSVEKKVSGLTCIWAYHALLFKIYIDDSEKFCEKRPV